MPIRNFSVDSLIAQCRSSDSSLQIEAIQSLLNQKAYVAVPAVVNLLASPDDVVRSTAARALGELGTQDIDIAHVGTALTNLLVDPESIVRSEAVDTLGIIGYTPAVEAIISLLHNDPEPFVRASAAESLGDLGDVKALKDLELAILDPDESVRAYAANAIGLLATAQILPKLQAYLESETSSRVKAELLGAKSRLGALEDFKLLLNLLDTADEDLAICLLNLLRDLTERKVPSVLTDHVDIMIEILTRVSQRFSILRSDVEMLVTHLMRSDHLPKVY
ncbi:HEAT repeat domain-containing protein [Gloeocapsa sp. PCC 73106]|uniref:HEAT repeat domain-containing protein n=1 Tax=Gloeocapsa sp. PCC 73106 TaxID=102232 RepID=UPI0002AD0DB3|nr:HEAT repeat domain-containing protein [Gloeocapsa sp. PCC 73106]ELR98563.1 HEAT-like repeat protein [Gloeocapsa sp. PCC 73106]